MKKMLFSLAMLAFLTSNLMAQDTIRTLIHASKIRNVGLYVAPEFQYGQSNAEMTAFSGGSAMLILNHRFALGVTMQESIDESFSPKGVAPLVLRSAFGGGKIEYTVRPASPIHITFPLVIGMGEARADSVRTTETEVNHENHNGNEGRDGGLSASYFVIQPGIQVEANLVRFAKIFVGANYRITSAYGTASTLPTDALSGFAINAGVKVGLFDIHRPKPIHFGRRPSKKG